jgi:hypothetical protein
MDDANIDDGGEDELSQNFTSEDAMGGDGEDMNPTQG